MHIFPMFSIYCEVFIFFQFGSFETGSFRIWSKLNLLYILSHSCLYHELFVFKRVGKTTEKILTGPRSLATFSHASKPVPRTVQTFSSCTRCPDVCQCLVAQKSMANTSKNKLNTLMTNLSCKFKYVQL